MSENPFKSKYNYVFFKWITYIWMIISLGFVSLMGIEQVLQTGEVLKVKLLFILVVFIGLITGFKYKFWGGLMVGGSFTGFILWFWITRNMLVSDWLWYLLISMPGILLLILSGYEFKQNKKIKREKAKKSKKKNKSAKVK